MRFATFVFVSFLVWSAASASPQREFNRSFASSHLKFLAPDSLTSSRASAPFLHWLLQGVLSREPDSGPKDFAAGCRPDDLEDALRATGSAARQAGIIDAHFRRCVKDVETGVNHRFLNSFQIMRIALDLKHHPFVEKVEFDLPGGSKLKGLLALKGDRRPRPFVILRLGVFSNIDEFSAERYLLMQLFEQGPANLLVLENVTGAAYVETNPGFSVGGAVEGLQNIQLAKLLRDPREPLSELVGSLHLMSISLGGNGLFTAAALDPRQEGGPRFDSFVGLCPVVHLKDTLRHAVRPGFNGASVDWWVSMRLAGLKDRVAGLTENHWDRWFRGIPWYFPEALDFAEKVYPAQPGLAAGVTLPPDYPKDLWAASEPWPWFRDIKAPVLVVATKEDDLVPVRLNFDDFVGMMKGRHENTGAVMLERGFHCTLPVAYDWNTIAAMLNGAVLAKDGSWKPREEVLDIDLGDVVDPAAARAPAKISYDLEWPDEGAFVRVKTRIEAATGDAGFSMNLPLSGFDFVFRDDHPTAPVQRMVERWLHRNLKMDLVPKEGRSFLRLAWRRAG